MNPAVEWLEAEFDRLYHARREVHRLRHAYNRRRDRWSRRTGRSTLRMRHRPALVFLTDEERTEYQAAAAVINDHFHMFDGMVMRPLFELISYEADANGYAQASWRTPCPDDALD